VWAVNWKRAVSVRVKGNRRSMLEGKARRVLRVLRVRIGSLGGFDLNG
jgi:hypothetical protein